MKLQYQLTYLNSDLVFEEKSLSSLDDILSIIQNSMEQLSQSSEFAAANQEGADGPTLPCVVLNCNFPDGVATLNVYSDGKTFQSVWAMDARRWSAIPLIKKDYFTKLKPTTYKGIREEVALLRPTAAQTIEQFKLLEPKSL